MKLAVTIGSIGTLLVLVSLYVLGRNSGDACSLLPESELQAFAGPVTVGSGKAAREAKLGSRLCHWEWGSGTNLQSGRSYLDIAVTPATKAFPGLDTAMIRQGLLAKRGLNTAVVPGIGEAAVFESNTPVRVDVSALAKGNMLLVIFESANARGQKDHVIQLLKTAVGRL